MGWETRDYNRDENQGIPKIVFQFPPFTKLTIVLLVINFALFLMKPFGTPYEYQVVYGSLAFHPVFAPWWEVWRWVTYQYIHATGGHVFFNMLVLYFFLPTMELRWGWAKALGFYTLGGIAAGFVFLLLQLILGGRPSLVGASGSIFAIMGAVALFYPERQFIFGIPIRVGVCLCAILFLLTIVGDGNYSDAAHLGGLAFGFFAPYVAGPYIARQRNRYREYRENREVQAEINEQQEVDRILAKVAEKGMHSLTAGERKVLDRASQNQRKREAEREKKLRASW